MSDLLPADLTVTAPQGLNDPGEILHAIAAQLPALTGGALQGEVMTMHLRGFQVMHDLNAIVARGGPGHGLLTADHTLTSHYPVYVSARCFGEVWPPPPLGPSAPADQIAPCARTPEEFVALINQVLALRQARNVLKFLIAQQQSSGSNGAATTVQAAEASSDVFSTG